MKTLVASAVGLFGFAGICHAGQIASPAIYAGFSQNVAFCVIYNGGSTTQSVNVRLFDEAGNVLTGVNTSCGAPLGPGQYCSIAKIGISNDNAYACAACRGLGLTSARQHDPAGRFGRLPAVSAVALADTLAAPTGWAREPSPLCLVVVIPALSMLKARSRLRSTWCCR